MELNAGLRGTARHPAPPAGVFLRAGAVSGLLSAGLGIAGGVLEGALTGPWPDA